MDISVIILGCLVICALVTMIFFVAFGQITVRKLRANPETKSQLGIELVSGWDIINVAQTLSLPYKLVKKFREGRLSFLYADIDLLMKYTSKFDRYLAVIFYWMLTFTGFSSIFWSLLVTFDFFK